MATNYNDQFSGSGSPPTPVDAVTGAGETVAYKAPCRLATTGNIVLSGHQVIDGSMTANDDRILVRLQTDETRNGIWIASAGAWQRARDFDTNRDITKGTRATVTDGVTLGGKEYLITSESPIRLGTDDIAFAETLSSDAGSSAAAAEAAAALTFADRVATAADRVQTGLDRVATGADRTQTGLDAASAASSAGSASGSAGTAATSAGQAMTFRNQAEGYKNAAAQSETNAGNAAALAEKWAEEDEDVEVVPGQYSAKHWAAKSLESSSEVTSVNGKIGTVVLTAASVGAAASDDARLTNSREWTASTVSQAEAEAGAATTRRAWTAQRVAQAIAALGGFVADGAVTFAKLASAAIASAADLRGGTASKLVDAATVHSSMAWVAITAGASPAIDHAAGVNRSITHTANATMGAPSNSKPGFPLNIDITPATYTTSWNSAFKFGSSGAPSITARTIVHFMCRQSGEFVFLGTSDPS